MIEPLRIAFEVGCSPERTFELWTAQTSTWWPSTHTVSAQPGVEVIIEPGVGGRIYERTPQGDEHDWGQVTGWEPAPSDRLPLAPAPGPRRRDRSRDHVHRRRPRRNSRVDRAPRLGTTRRPRPGTPTPKRTRLVQPPPTLPRRRPLTGPPGPTVRTACPTRTGPAPAAPHGGCRSLRLRSRVLWLESREGFVESVEHDSVHPVDRGVCVAGACD